MSYMAESIFNDNLKSEEDCSLGPCALCLFKSKTIKGTRVFTDLEGNQFSACGSCFSTSIANQKNWFMNEMRSVVDTQ